MTAESPRNSCWYGSHHACVQQTGRLSVLFCSVTTGKPIRDWWRTYPEANIGHIILPHRLVLDIDPRHGGLIGWRNLSARHGDLPAIWKLWTGRQDGGFHLHLTLPDEVFIPQTTDIEMGVQVLGPRHLVLLPPSIHPDTGKAYAWDAAYNPSTLPQPAMAPDWLLNLVLDVHAKKSSKRARTSPRVQAQHVGADEAAAEGFKPPGDGYAGESTKVPRDVPPPLGTLVDAPGKHLVALACDPRHLPAMLKACDLPETLEVGWSTRCPFHDDQHPSASLLGPSAEQHSYGLYCHASSCKRYYSLLDIFKARTSANLQSIHTETDSSGRKRDHTALRLQWLTRLLEAAGIVHLYELGCPSLPHYAPDYVRDVWATFLHVRRMRSATRKTSDPMPSTWRFCKDWMGRAGELGQHVIQKAKSFLIAHGLLHADHKEDGITFWQIGSKALRHDRRDAPIFKTERENVAAVDATPVPELLQVDRTSACPYADVREPAFDKKHCVYCLQAYLDNKRAQLGIWIDPRDPFGRGSLALSPT